MTLKTEGFESVPVGTAFSGSNTNFDVVIIGTTGPSSGVGASDWAYLGARSLRIGKAVGDGVYGLWQGYSVTQAAQAWAFRLNALPTIAAGSSCKLLAARAGSTNIGALRFVNGASGGIALQHVANNVSKKETPPLDTGIDYVLRMVTIIGATTGRLISEVWADGALWSSYDSGATLAMGTTNLDNFRSGPMDSPGSFDGWGDWANVNDGSATQIALPVKVTASANAGVDSYLEPFANSEPGDGITARANLNASASTATGGTAVGTWTGPAGVTFTDVHDPFAQAILPQGITQQTFTLTWTYAVGAVSDSDDVAVIVAGSDEATISGGQWVASRTVPLTP